ncbi:unnamed protein product [Rotaria sp. Silwood2]|nr:unnamed protein product [Rotaria sp. Silwood2]CAF2685453.1 unnamed protein product [Rotaria sp. Silwood2]CAF3411593.1 unnamed protein product [Rotaria sp. Silwood2]CAF3973793.1 unnamed protein product [Rotaria sp. Silwood2]CAF3992808.1 unnamed protein product [Rotaria sp. Silwood2]
MITKQKKNLCPSSYFGDQCQWQNQRVGLTVQLVHRADTYTIAVFQIIIMLIYEQRPIASYHEQIIWYLSIPCQFLPINRIATQLFIQNTTMILPLCPLFCGEHGRCVEYINKKLLYFCQCNEGYSGSHCTIKDNCSCSSDSYCLRSSICVCPMNKFGSRCYLESLICQTI